MRFSAATTQKNSKCPLPTHPTHHPAQMPPSKKPKEVPIPPELAGIIRSASCLGTAGKKEPISTHLDAIRRTKCHETTSFLRAAMVRLKNTM